MRSGQHPRQTEGLPSNAHPETATPHVERTCLQGLADFERLETMVGDDAEHVAIVLRLLLAHLKVLSDRLNKAMAVDRSDAERATSSRQN